MRAPFKIDRFEWPSRTAALKHMSNLLQSQELWEPLSGDDLEVMTAVLSRHPDCDSKIGCGVVSIYVGPAAPRGRCFWVQRVDGTADDFSFRCAINGEPPLRTKLMSCCRAAVVDSIISFKTQAFAGGMYVPCVETGVALTWQTAHVDHDVTPFVRIADEWLKAASPDLLEIAPDVPGVITGWRFLIDEAKASFKAFHDERARLRIVSPFTNMSKGAR